MATVKEVLARALGEQLPQRAVTSILSTLPPSAAASVGALDLMAVQEILNQVSAGVRIFGGSIPTGLVRELRRKLVGGAMAPAREERIPVSSDADVLVVQTHCQLLCRSFFGATDCVRLATAASELARNIYLYAGAGELTLTLSEEPDGVRLTVTARDQGPGIADPEHILSGKYVSKTGLGRGLVGTKVLLSDLAIESTLGKGTVVRGSKKARYA